MNVIMIVADTLRKDFLGCYGNEWISTPNIDRFAKQATVFDRAYTASFPTVPNRHDVMTGRYTFTYSKWEPLPRDERVLAQELTEAGYMTMMILDTPHIIENGFYFDRGFEGLEWIRGQESDRWRTSPAEPKYPCDPKLLRKPEGIRFHQRNIEWWRYEEDTFVARTMQEASLWLERNYQQHENFFLYVDTFDPHEPWDAPDWYVKMYADPEFDGQVVNYPIYGPCDYLSEAELKHLRSLYAAEVTLVDRWIGRLMQRITDMGLLDDTVVIVTTDHGYYHGEHGYTGKTIIDPQDQEMIWIPLYGEVTQIPLMIHVPGVEPHRESAIVQPVDIMPTILDFAGTKPSTRVDGKSLVPLLRGTGASTRNMAVTSPTLVDRGLGGARPTITTDEWVLVCSPSHLPDKASMDLSVDGYKHYLGFHETESELYHLPSDPDQKKNVIAEHPDVAQELRAQFVSMLESSNTSPELIAPWR